MRKGSFLHGVRLPKVVGKGTRPTSDMQTTHGHRTIKVSKSPVKGLPQGALHAKGLKKNAGFPTVRGRLAANVKRKQSKQTSGY